MNRNKDWFRLRGSLLIDNIIKCTFISQGSGIILQEEVIMVVSHNLYAINANRMLGAVNQKNGKITEKLSSGYRINRAADDAAGLSISEKMRRQIRGLTQASANAQDGISLVQSAEGALNEMHEIVQRGNELAVKAANGILTDEEREMVDAEIQQLKQALDESAHTTVFNEIRLFPDDGDAPRSSVEQTAHYELKFQMTDGAFTITGPADTAQTSTADGDTVSQVLADRIANEFVPNAIQQIFDTFSSLSTAVGSNVIEMALDISYIDGPSNTLAYAQCSFYSTSGTEPFNFLIKVDSADFTDADALGTGSKSEMLESTLAHELMHSVMQYTMTDEMTGRAGEEFPTWFVEGTAQLSGGGYTTGWNDTLTTLTLHLDNEEDNANDAAIESYLKKYTVEGRPYGHGYLASAYLGYLASGSRDVTSEAIADGMDKIFQSIIDGKSFSEAIVANTKGLTVSDIENLFATGDADLVKFVRKLSYHTGDGAGSVITSSLDVRGTNILGDTATVQQFRIDPDKVNVDASSSGGKTKIWLQLGAESGVGFDVELFRMDAQALDLEDTNVKTQEAAGAAINAFKAAITGISKVRSYYGAVQNRLDHTINNLDNVVENTTEAESAIRDTDMATTMVELTTNNILQQAGQAMLSQANRYPEFVLQLLS